MVSRGSPLGLKIYKCLVSLMSPFPLYTLHYCLSPLFLLRVPLLRIVLYLEIPVTTHLITIVTFPLRLQKHTVYVYGNVPQEVDCLEATT